MDRGDQSSAGAASQLKFKSLDRTIDRHLHSYLVTNRIPNPIYEIFVLGISGYVILALSVEVLVPLSPTRSSGAIRIATAHGLSSWTLGFDAGGAAQAAAQVGACAARTRWR